jgi:hypothetical protein
MGVVVASLSHTLPLATDSPNVMPGPSASSSCSRFTPSREKTTRRLGFVAFSYTSLRPLRATRDRGQLELTAAPFQLAR